MNRFQVAGLQFCHIRAMEPDPDAYALDWFMTFKKLPLEKHNLPPATSRGIT